MVNFPGASELLLNVCIVFMGTLVLELFSPVINSKLVKSSVICAVLNIEMFLCMLFPFESIDGFSFDLRAIPMIIGPMYGNYVTAPLMYLIFVTYRIVIGGPQTGTAIAIGTILMTVTFLVSKTLLHRAVTKTMITATIPMSLLLIILDFVLWVNLQHTSKTSLTLLMFDVVNLIVLWGTVFALEYISENSKLRQELYRAEKYQVLGELAAAMAHEIRNPMTVSKGFLQLTRESPEIPSHHKEYLKTAVDELDRAHEIINEYLSFARPQVDVWVQLSVKDQADHVVEILRPYAVLKNVTLYSELVEDLTIYGDPKKITQIFMNIIKNGIEAMPHGGQLTIQTDRYRPYARIKIKDTGLGMKQEELSRLGNPFYSTKANGTGLGLMTSYRLCQAMGGKIEVTSVPCKGTEFAIYLPLAGERGQL